MTETEIRAATGEGEWRTLFFTHSLILFYKGDYHNVTQMSGIVNLSEIDAEIVTLDPLDGNRGYLYLPFETIEDIV